MVKLPSVARTNLDPVIFNFYVCIGVCLSSWLVIPCLAIAEMQIGFTIAGFSAGVLFVIAIGFSFLTIRLIGLSIGQGTWGGTAILVSFMWGALGPTQLRKPLRSQGWSLVALCLLLLGVLGIVFCEQVAKSMFSSSTDAAYVDMSPDGPVDIGDERRQLRGTAKGRRLAGLLCAILVGVFGGSILVPLAFVEEAFRGFAFVPSFGLGSLVAGAIGTFIYSMTVPDLKWHIRETMWAGVISGVLWNVGNYCSIFAMAYAGLNYGIAYPILQCALFISGLWGIFAFKEIHSALAILVFFLSSILLLVGATILGLYGPA